MVAGLFELDVYIQIIARQRCKSVYIISFSLFASCTKILQILSH